MTIHNKRPLKVALLTFLGSNFLPLLCSALSTKSSQAIIENRAVQGLKNGMDYVKVGTSDLLVSKVCMGTMTFGEVSVMYFGVCGDIIFPDCRNIISNTRIFDSSK